MQDDGVVERTSASSHEHVPDDGPRAVATIALARTGPVRWASVVATLWLSHLLVVTIIGGVHQGPEAFGAHVVSTALYLLAGLGFGALLTLALLVQLAASQRRRVPRWTIEVLIVACPLAASTLLAAAYVSRLGDGHFIGGGSAMLALTVSLVLLARRAAHRA
ncbi:hypothetical protein [Frigoribacterium salinisoli]